MAHRIGWHYQDNENKTLARAPMAATNPRVARKAPSAARVLWELARYDLLYASQGIAGVRPRPMRFAGAGSTVLEAEICEALRSVAPFYWKPIRCLQRSIVTARLMRGRGIPAEVVIGYRAAPFFSHAWVEIAGRVANDSPVYQARLQVLDRF